MVNELESLGDLGSFKMIPRPSGANVLQSTWTFKRKRYPDGQLRKYKTRFCVRRYQHVERIDIFDIHACLVSWIIVRLLSVLSLVLNLNTQHVDYINDFCQAPIDQTVYIGLLRGLSTEYGATPLTVCIWFASVPTKLIQALKRRISR